MVETFTKSGLLSFILANLFLTEIRSYFTEYRNSYYTLQHAGIFSKDQNCMSHSERSGGEEGNNLWELERVHARTRCVPLARAAPRREFFVPEIFRQRRGASRCRRRHRRRRRCR